MPMSWTPENDRLLLLKLIETHGISVDSNKIVAAWPDGPVKPTARAVTERFVKLRQLAGIKASISTGTPGRARPRQSKYTTPKKRKTKADTDESDADDQVTEEESPTKSSAQRTGGRGRDRGSALGGRDGRGGRGIPTQSPPIKSEFPVPEVQSGSPDTMDNFDGFERSATHATELRQAVEIDPFTDYGVAVHSGSVDGFGLPMRHHDSTGFGMGDAVFNNGYADAGTSLQDSFSVSNGFQVRTTRPSAVPSEGSRHRSVRKASAQASEGVAAFLRRQKDEDEAEGEKSSDEDSQASEYHDLEGDYI